VIDKIESDTINFFVSVGVQQDFFFYLVNYNFKVMATGSDFLNLLKFEAEYADSVFAAIVCVDFIFYYKRTMIDDRATNEPFNYERTCAILSVSCLNINNARLNKVTLVS